MVRSLKPSLRGELEITDLNNMYLERGELNVRLLSSGTQWVDTGSIDNLMEAAAYVKEVESISGKRIAVPEEIAWRMGNINASELRAQALKYGKSGYGKYLLGLLDED